MPRDPGGPLNHPQPAQTPGYAIVPQMIQGHLCYLPMRDHGPQAGFRYEALYKDQRPQPAIYRSRPMAEWLCAQMAARGCQVHLRLACGCRATLAPPA